MSRKKALSNYILLLLMLLLVFAGGYLIFQKRIDILKKERYNESVSEMQAEISTLIAEKKEAIELIALSMSKNIDIKKALLANKHQFLDLQTFADYLQKNTSLKNIWFQVLDENGKSFYRTWSKKRGDDLSLVRDDVFKIIKNPKILSSISVGKFDLTFKTMVPIFDKDVCIGFVEAIGKVNSIAKKMEKRGFHTVFLVDKRYKKQLLYPFTKLFLDDYYIANLNVNKKLFSIIKRAKIEKLKSSKDFFVDKISNHLVGVHKLYDNNGKDMVYIILIRDIDKISIEKITQSRDKLALTSVLIFFILIALFYYVYDKRYKNFILKNNKRLELKVNEKTKSLEYLANHDPLTELPNRMLCIDRLNQYIKSHNRTKKSIGVLFLDLDRFKEINDSFGHDVGDELLIEVASRLKESVRDSDTVARLGGDEFLIIVEDIDQGKLSLLVEKIIFNINKDVFIRNITLHTSFSIGISTFPNDGKTSDVLIRNADTAMYKAKDLGKNRYQFYNTQMTQEALEKIELKENIYEGLKNHEFVPYYQPKVDARSGKIIGMEALARWVHPTLGLIQPNKFIPLAEEVGLIIEIDKQIMKHSLNVLQKWQNDGLETGKLSLNLSIKQLDDENFISDLKEIISKTSIKSNSLELEITEGHLIKNPDKIIKILMDARDLGISISIDDFGTGYSSLRYLKKLPIDTLKIDKSFVDDVPRDEDDVAIVKTIITLAKSLNLDLIAEGVETKEQKEFLLNHDCYAIQGYLYLKPVDEKTMKEFLLNKFL